MGFKFNPFTSKLDVVGTTLDTDTATSFTTGSIIFVGSDGTLQEDNSNLFWDDTNNRLGIGMNTPTHKVTIGAGFHIQMQNSTSLLGRTTGGSSSTLVQSSGSNSVRIGDTANWTGGIEFRPGAATAMTLTQGGLLGIGIAAPTAVCHLSASTTSRASMRVPTGTAPTSPNEGDVYADGTDIFYRTSAGAWVDLTSLGGMAIGDAVTGGTAGSILFVDASGNLGQDNSNLFWDDTNNRLGIGTASPSLLLHLLSAASNTGMLKLDQTTNGYTGTAAYLGFDADIDVDSAASTSKINLTGFDFNVTQNHDINSAVFASNTQTNVGMNFFLTNTAIMNGSALFSTYVSETFGYKARVDENGSYNKVSVIATGMDISLNETATYTAGSNSSVSRGLNLKVAGGPTLSGGSLTSDVRGIDLEVSNTTVGTSKTIGIRYSGNSGSADTNWFINSIADVNSWIRGQVAIGGVSETAPTAMLDVISDAAAVITQIVKGAASQSANLTEWRNSSGTVLLNVQSGGDLEFDDGVDIIFDTTTGTKIGTATSQMLAFYNSAPIIQPSSTGETTGFTAGAGTGVNDDSTFTGNVGATAYRISDIVKHLKNLGLIAA